MIGKGRSTQGMVYLEKKGVFVTASGFEFSKRCGIVGGIKGIEEYRCLIECGND